MSGSKSLAELAAELEDPRPKDVDPEALEDAEDSSSDGKQVNDEAGREHYEAVSKSRLRKQETLPLGSQYSGSKVRRQDLDPFEDQGDEAFAREPGFESYSDSESDDGRYDDPDTVDLDLQDDEDEEIDSDEAFEDEEEEESFRRRGFTFQNSGSSNTIDKNGKLSISQKGKGGNQQEDHQGESDESSPDTEFDELQINSEASDASDLQGNGDLEDKTDGDSGSSDDEDDDEQVDADVLRAMTSAEQKHLVSGLSSAMESEVHKGVAIKRQYATFDSFVGARVHLQKSLIAANSLPLGSQSLGDHTAISEAAEAAEHAAMNVFNSLTALLYDLRKAENPNKGNTALGKRPFSATMTMASEDILNAINADHQAYKPQRREILTRWANKTQANNLSVRNKLLQRPTEDDLLTILDGQLLGTNQDHLIRKTQVARSCAPLQQAVNARSNSKMARDGSNGDATMANENADFSSLPVYDDADFYALILRELIDHKKSYNNSSEDWVANSAMAEATTPSNLLRINKSRRVNVDTKASKGRKMKYTVHEQLQNFMAPVNLGKWEIRQAEELFAGLLGRKIPKLDETNGIEIEDIMEEDAETQGLRLFGSA